MDYILKKLHVRENISSKMLQINAYVDDVIKISGNLKAREELLQESDKASQPLRPIINQ
jgi:hypothetical protein